MQKIGLKGKVIHGKKLGREIGFRTANIKYSGDLDFGVYKTLVFVSGKKYKGASSYREETGIFETHILDFSGDIYDQEIEIYILEKIRDNKKVENLEELKKLIQNDVIYVKNTENIVLTFGTFDVTHPGHMYYLGESQFYGDKLVTIVARDESVLKFKGEMPLRSQEFRVKDIEEMGFSDVVELGHPTDYYACIKKWKPKIISLGYDQRSANVGLEEYLNKEGIDSEIVIMKPFEEQKYKSSLIKKKLN